MVKCGEASLSSLGRAREGVILGVDKAAWKPVSGAASAVAVAVVTEAPSAGVLVETVVTNRRGSRGHGEADHFSCVLL